MVTVKASASNRPHPDRGIKGVPDTVFRIPVRQKWRREGMPALIQVNDLQYVVDWHRLRPKRSNSLRPSPKRRPKSPNAHHPKATGRKKESGKESGIQDDLRAWSPYSRKHGREIRRADPVRHARHADPQADRGRARAQQGHTRAARAMGSALATGTRMETQTPARGEKTREGNQLNDSQDRPGRFIASGHLLMVDSDNGKDHRNGET